ncbi:MULTISPECIES: aldo/keto reductase [unclassified Bradyrhizobium]|uniref:aldo/keto reductase n=1 Tax=unclassified Bradyrhizobium TaxID=2631580 RepID=UPI0028E8D817|nr:MULTISPECIES: aldo/keto reductase [unclassified Bradyrhizobium]
MKYRQLGTATVSEIGLGCSAFWGSRFFSERTAVSIVHQAYEHGINLFDTGHNYSNYNAEPRLGRALASLIKSEGRDRLVISTKAGTLRRKPLIRDVPRTNYSPDYIEGACSKAIKNLGCDYIDVFQLHGAPRSAITDELLTRLDRMRQRGMFRMLGINTHSKEVMHYITSLGRTFDVALIDVNVMQLDRLPTIHSMRAAGISILAGTVLAQGHLVAGKIGRIRRPSDIWYLARALMRPQSRLLAGAASKMRKVLSGIPDVTPAQAAIASILSFPEISSCIIGTTDLRNLREISETPHRAISKDALSRIIATFDQGTFPISG